MRLSSFARGAAAAIALVAWTGIGLLLADQATRLGGDVGAALWANARFFTDVSNLFIALVFTALATAPGRVSSRLFGAPLAATTMASVVYYGLLGGADALGANGLGDVLAHAVIPALVAAFWITARPGRRFAWRDIPVWMVFPLGYVVYAIGRGLVDGRYPYFFLNVPRLGWGVGGYVLAILLLFGAIGAVLVVVDRRLKRDGGTRSNPVGGRT